MASRREMLLEDNIFDDSDLHSSSDQDSFCNAFDELKPFIYEPPC